MARLDIVYQTKNVYVSDQTRSSLKLAIILDCEVDISNCSKQHTLKWTNAKCFFVFFYHKLNYSSIFRQESIYRQQNTADWSLDIDIETPSLSFT